MRRRRMERRACALVLAGALGAGALAGCTSGDNDLTPTPTPTVSSTSASPTPTPSPSPTETSTIPAAAREKSEKGAEAFVRYFVQQSAEAWMIPDSALIKSISSPDCESCTSLAATADELSQKGHRYASEPITVISVEALTSSGARMNVGASIKQHKVDVVDRKGNKVSTDKAASLERTFLLYWEGGRWVVGGIA